ncbi:hypothetical protein [Pseudoalteromonas prydzensis]|uniref:hypothetical protein n=1 Tax=Pseudoalteromonas prydzensis TaxID=182141 RepID=UPI0024BCAD37|nr:hypothetical protein [Pseudoalteromonas prydzensis]
MNEKYISYKMLKARLDGHAYKNYPLDLVLGSYLGMMTWKPSLSLYFQYLFLNIKSFNFPKSQIIINTYSTKRDDYTSFIKGYFPNAELQYVRVVNSRKEMLLGCFNSFIYFFKAFFYSLKLKSNMSERLKLIIALSLGFKVIDELEKKIIKCDKYVAFNSSYLIESFLSYYFRLRNIETYSLQHGMYFNYCNETPYDVINFENVCAEKLLVWGAYSLKEVKNIVPQSTECLLFGYPRSQYPVNLTQTKVEKVLVLLPRDIYLEDVKILLEYLQKYAFSYIVRPHPTISEYVNDIITTQKRFYLDTNTVLTSTLNKSRYAAVIGFNSTAVFEAALYNQNVFIFKSSRPEFINPGFNDFDINDNLPEVLRKKNSLVKNDFFVPAGQL